MKVTIDLKYDRENFHDTGPGPIDLIIDPDNVYYSIWGDETPLIRISSRQAQRIRRHFCGMSYRYCVCTPLVQLGWDDWALHPHTIGKMWVDGQLVDEE